jgi:hypothetical protein
MVSTPNDDCDEFKVVEAYEILTPEVDMRGFITSVFLSFPLVLSSCGNDHSTELSDDKSTDKTVKQTDFRAAVSNDCSVYKVFDKIDTPCTESTRIEITAVESKEGVIEKVKAVYRDGFLDGEPNYVSVDITGKGKETLAGTYKRGDLKSVTLPSLLLGKKILRLEITARSKGSVDGRQKFIVKVKEKTTATEQDKAQDTN